MNPINPENDGLDNLLEAGRLRTEAAKLGAHADLLEQAAALQLQQSEAAQQIGIRMMGTVLVLACGGEAGGAMLYLPFKDLNDNIELAANPSAQCTGAEVLQFPRRARYQPALILQLGENVAAALLVPYGGIPGFARDLPRGGSRAVRGVAELVVRGIGFHPELVHGVVESVRGAFARSTVPNAAMVLQLGEARA